MGAQSCKMWGALQMLIRTGYPNWTRNSTYTSHISKRHLKSRRHSQWELEEFAATTKRSKWELNLAKCEEPWQMLIRTGYPNWTRKSTYISHIWKRHLKSRRHSQWELEELRGPQRNATKWSSLFQVFGRFQMLTGLLRIELIRRKPRTHKVCDAKRGGGVKDLRALDCPVRVPNCDCADLRAQPQNASWSLSMRETDGWTISFRVWMINEWMEIPTPEGVARAMYENHSDG